VPKAPDGYDDLVDALREHPEWRHDIRDFLDEEGGGDGGPPPRRRLVGWLPALGMGALIGAIAAGVVSFALLNDDGDDGALPAATASPAEERTAVAAATVAEETGTPPTPAPERSPQPTPTRPAAAASATPTAAPATRTAQAESTVVRPTPVPQASPATPASGTPTAVPDTTFTFAGFEGTCAPVFAVLRLENVSEPVTIDAAWTNAAGATVITVQPLTIEPVPPGAVVTAKFPTVAPLSPGRYYFTAEADGVNVASDSVDITC
jgi:hypothetical protein